MPHRGDGPIPARIMVVGEAWGRDEDDQGFPFAGVSGQELNRMLHEAGILRSECFVTNLINHRPLNNDIGQWIALKKKDVTPAHVPLFNKMVLPIVMQGYQALLAEINSVQPNVIIACGNWPMWALTAGKCYGIRNWRGSLLRAALMQSSKGVAPLDTSSADNNVLWTAPKLIPTIHPAAVLREWSQRAAVVSDLRRVKAHCESREYKFPDYQYLVKPTINTVVDLLQGFLTKLDADEVLWFDGDYETGRKHRHIKCFGISWSRTDSICIPIMCLRSRDGYWTVDEETQIIWLLKKLLTHKNARVRWQNGLFDAQYTWRYWHFIPRCDQDTMISQHAMFSDSPKTLAYIASIFNENYIFWKEEGKTELDEAPSYEKELEGWVYNGKDCVNTREAGEGQLATLDKFVQTSWPKAKEVHAFQQAMFYPVLKAMIRGVKVRPDVRNQLANEIQEEIASRQETLQFLVGHEINPRSSVQMCKLFYEDLGQPPIMTRPKKGIPAHVTCDDEALQKISAREPLLKPIINCISDIRTLEIFLGNFVLAALDVDGRMRCSYNIGGSEAGKTAPKTYRLSSSKNAFGSGGNLQNIPGEKSKSVGKAAQRGKIAALGDPYALPNIRSLYGPDHGCDFFDLDLDRADLQVMAWDADEPLLKAALKQKVDLHLLNVYVLDGKEPPPLEELVETHPKYLDHRGPRKLKREFAKVFCHATDYLGKSRTVAAATGRTVHETDRAQGIYLATYKGIKTWQDNIIAQVIKRRYVENRFGYRWYIFDRIDDQVMPEAVAWIPQSTVSIVINRIWMNLFQGCTEDKWNFDPMHLIHLLHNTANGIEVLMQVHDSLAGQYPSHRAVECKAKLMELSQILIPYEDPLIIPTGLGTSSTTWGEC